jgi:hypothetical protein
MPRLTNIQETLLLSVIVTVTASRSTELPSDRQIWNSYHLRPSIPATAVLNFVRQKSPRKYKPESGVRLSQCRATEVKIEGMVS